MEAREQRGLIIAALCQLNRQDGMWLVPSQSGTGKTYSVNLGQKTCTCPDHADTGSKCKHIYAVEFVLRRELNADGTITETRSMTLTTTEKKPTVKRDWPLYDYAQITEKNRFLTLLAELCKGAAEPKRAKTGRPPAPMADMVFACAYKVYSTFGSRRFGCDLAQAHKDGHLSFLMHPVTICSFMQEAEMTPVLEELIVQSSLPLVQVEDILGVDSTGFSVSQYDRWVDDRNMPRTKQRYMKAHAMMGMRTHIVTAVRVLDQNSADCPQFEPLLEKTKRYYPIKTVVADKAYLSHAHFNLVAGYGGAAFLQFKVNSTPGLMGSVWEKMFLRYRLCNDIYRKVYNQRSNAEAVFSAIKRKHMGRVRSTNEVAKKNDILCKFLVHNICQVHQSHIVLGIEPEFFAMAERPVEPPPPPPPNFMDFLKEEEEQPPVRPTQNHDVNYDIY